MGVFAQVFWAHPDDNKTWDELGCNNFDFNWPTHTPKEAVVADRLPQGKAIPAEKVVKDLQQSGLLKSDDILDKSQLWPSDWDDYSFSETAATELKILAEKLVPSQKHYSHNFFRWSWSSTFSHSQEDAVLDSVEFVFYAHNHLAKMNPERDSTLITGGVLAVVSDRLETVNRTEPDIVPYSSYAVSKARLSFFHYAFMWDACRMRLDKRPAVRSFEGAATAVAEQAVHNSPQTDY